MSIVYQFPMLDGHPTFYSNPYNEYRNPYYWVDDHPLLYGNNGSLDPSTCPNVQCLHAISPFLTHWRGPLCFLSLTSIANVLGAAQSPSMAHPMDESRHTLAFMALFSRVKADQIIIYSKIRHDSGKNSSKILSLHLFLNIIQFQPKVQTSDFLI